MYKLTHGGEADSQRCSFANMFKHLGLAVATNVVSHLKVAKSPFMKEERNIRYIIDISLFG